MSRNSFDIIFINPVAAIGNIRSVIGFTKDISDPLNQRECNVATSMFHTSSSDRSQVCDSLTGGILNPNPYCAGLQRINKGMNGNFLWKQNYDDKIICVNAIDTGCLLYNTTNSCIKCPPTHITR